MNLRTSKVLKYVAILLFTMESLAPTLFSTSYAPQKPATCSTVEKTFSTQNLFLSLYAEEVDTEERAEAGVRQIVQVGDQMTEDHFLSLADEALSQSLYLSGQERHKSSPPLFELHCTYLI